MKRGDGTVGWQFAESQRLDTIRVGDVLTFHLTGLRPGTLRIISRLRRQQPISHVFTRREPNEDDSVLEINLTQLRDDLVIGNQHAAK